MILHVVINDLRNDARVLRAARVGEAMGQPVTIFARHGSGLAETERAGAVHVRRFRLATQDWSRRRPVQLLKYGELAVKMVRAGTALGPSLVHANDLNALPIGYAIARRTGARLLYDSHELWSSVLGPGRPGAAVFRPALRLERLLARRADAVITVSEGIAEEMSRRLRIAVPRVVRNIPDPPAGFDSLTQAPSPLRRALGVGAEVPVVLYQGAITHGRGLPTLLAAMTHLRHPTAMLVFMGDGPLVPALRRQVDETSELRGRVTFLRAVPATEVLLWTRGASIGVHPIEGGLLNHDLCLPNKLFEYVQAGLPVVVSDLPEMSRVVKRHSLGLVFPSGDAAALARQVDALLSDARALARYRRAAAEARLTLTWSAERTQLRAIYHTLVSSA